MYVNYAISLLNLGSSLCLISVGRPIPYRYSFTFDLPSSVSSDSFSLRCGRVIMSSSCITPNKTPMALGTIKTKSQTPNPKSMKKRAQRLFK